MQSGIEKTSADSGVQQSHSCSTLMMAFARMYDSAAWTAKKTLSLKSNRFSQQQDGRHENNLAEPKTDVSWFSTSFFVFHRLAVV